MNEHSRLPLLGSGLTVLALVAGFLNLATLVGVGRQELLTSPDALLPVVASVVGWLIVRHVPRNPVGWLLLGAALSSALFGASALVVMESVAVPSMVGDLAAWLSTWVFMPSYLIAFLFVPMLFPDGRLVAKLWRPVLWASAALLVGESVLLAFGTEESIDPTVSNPFVVDAVSDALGLVEPAIWLSMAVLVVLGVVSLLHRFVRSQGQARIQILCVLVAVSVSVAYYLLTGSGLVLAVLLPASIAVAVLRYRLYDVERLLLRTVLYGGLAATAALVYVAAMLAAGILLDVDDDLRLQALAIVVAVLLIHPLRDRFMVLAHRLVHGRRSRPYDTLAALARQVGAAVDPDDTLPRMAAVIAEALAADKVTVTAQLVDGGTASCSIAADGDTSDDTAPVVHVVGHHGSQVGTIEVRRDAALTAMEEALLEVLVAQAGPALHTVALTAQLREQLAHAVEQAEQLRSSRARIVSAHDTARRSLERDLHDGAQQGLLAIAVEVGRIQRKVEEAPTEAVRRLTDLQELARRTLVDLRALAAGTYPSVLRELGLAAALRERTQDAAVEVLVHNDLTRRPAAEVESALYFSCMEAVTNALKHSQCNRVDVTLSEPVPCKLKFTVTDDGAGFDVTECNHGSGLTGISDRLGVFDGAMELTSRPGAGTTVVGVAYDADERYSNTA
jgi:two-component system, NarL family, sensor kinase